MEFRPGALEDMGLNRKFWKGKRVFVTGHTGFKGGWLCLWLKRLGADVAGYSLAPITDPSLFEVMSLSGMVESCIEDIRNQTKLQQVLNQFAPDIVVHMAAQPLVRYSYSSPVETYAVNVMGTVHLLEAVRTSPACKAVLVVTSDKCYENTGTTDGYRETDPMGGFDPYSSSKGCAELVVSAYRRSFFNGGAALATARAGNVLGGGDWSEDRLVPDLIRAFVSKQTAEIRMPGAIRPWQHVLDVLHGYMLLMQKMWEAPAEYSGPWNFGPDQHAAATVQAIADMVCQRWGNKAAWTSIGQEKLHEASTLKLDSTHARKRLQWQPKLDLSNTLAWTTDWYKRFYDGQDMHEFTAQQFAAYMSLQG